MEILEMKNTVAEIQKSNWVSSTAKWWGEENTEESWRQGNGNHQVLQRENRLKNNNNKRNRVSKTWVTIIKDLAFLLSVSPRG